MTETTPVAVVGAGAAGITAAIFAAGGPQPVLLLEGTRRPGAKILISGGGRCNVLPSEASAEDFITDGSPNTLRKIFNSWPLAEVREFFEKDLGLALRLEPETGKLFPVANRARAVLDALLARAAESGVGLRTGARVTGLERRESGWRIGLESGDSIEAGRVILATGGLSVPATGSDGAGLRLARGVGHTMLPTYPALVPLTCTEAAHHALAGVSHQVRISAPVPGSRRMLQSHGGFLFTHRGYSGPAVLNISHVATRAALLGGPRPPLFVQWTQYEGALWDSLLQNARGGLLSLLRRELPERMATLLLAEAGLAGQDLSHLKREERGRLVETLTHYPLPWTGSEGYKTAEVTGGGVSLAEVDSATLESRLAPALHLCGEILDAFGPIGGYNFLWAWITGRLAGLGCRHTGE